MLKKKSLVVLFVVAALASGIYLSFFKPEKSGDGDTAVNHELYPMKLVDSYQREVVIEREPSRIISLAPNITEIIYALGKEGKLVGRTAYCDYPAQVSKVASIGSITGPNIEKILQLRPDLVIASTHFQKNVLKKLDNLGVKVLILYGETGFKGVYDTVAKLGKVLNAPQKAAGVIAAMRKKVAFVTMRVKGHKRPRVYYVVGFGKSGDFTAGKDTFIGNMLEMAGGDNVAKDTRGWQYSVEKLVEKNPDILICTKYYHTKQAIESTPGYKDLPAVKEGRVFEIDNNLLDRQGPRLAEGLEALAKLLHPEVFKPRQGELTKEK